jgi:hypothetical protein
MTLKSHADMLSAVVVLAALSAAASRQPDRPGGVVIVKADEVAWTDYPNRPGVKLAMIEGDLRRRDRS